MYAVIRSGGKQYRVAPGQTIRLEKLAGDVGTKVELKDVLLVENDGNIQVGAPVVANATVEATTRAGGAIAADKPAPTTMAPKDQTRPRRR